MEASFAEVDLAAKPADIGSFVEIHPIAVVKACTTAARLYSIAVAAAAAP